MPDDAPKKRRLQSATEREAESDRARRERDGASVAIPFSDVGEDTAEVAVQYEDEGERNSALQAMRARRPTPERVRLLEHKHDQLAGKVGKIAESLASVDGQLKILPELVKDAAAAAREAASAAHAVATAHVKATITAQVDVEKTEAISEIKTATAEHLDVLDARKARRTRITKLAGLFTSGAVVAEVIHALLERFS